MAEDPKAVQERIAEVEELLANARARIPKHDVPAALVAEMDELDEELERLRKLVKPKSLDDQIAEVEARLGDVRSRVPKHDVPAALIAELDDLDEELERLRALRDTSA
jgi:hypothetical protein